MQGTHTKDGSVVTKLNISVQNAANGGVRLDKVNKIIEELDNETYDVDEKILEAGRSAVAIEFGACISCGSRIVERQGGEIRCCNCGTVLHGAARVDISSQS